MRARAADERDRHRAGPARARRQRGQPVGPQGRAHDQRAADRTDGARRRELYREVATGEQAKQIYQIGTQYKSADETLAKLGYAPNRRAGERGSPLRLGGLIDSHGSHPWSGSCVWRGDRDSAAGAPLLLTMLSPGGCRGVAQALAEARLSDDTPTGHINETEPLCALAVAVAFIAEASAQQYVYPAKGRSPEKQKSDEAACYTSSRPADRVRPCDSRRHHKPLRRHRRPQQARPRAPALVARRAVPWWVRSSVAIRGNRCGSGCGGRARPDRAPDAAGAQQARRQQQAATQQQQAAFGKARAACLEGRGYTVK